MEEATADHVPTADAQARPPAAVPATASAPTPTPLLLPRDGLPPIVDSAGELTRVVESYAAADGPVAIDAERASGYRYSHRAYLVQLRRDGAGTALIDPVTCPRLDELAAAIGSSEWIFHAASQDLPCLAEVGLTPQRIFDTELAGRLLDYPRVGLASLVEELLGLRLEKGHSAVDWSTRPLPEPWLVYAALDVEVLHELRDALARQLTEAGKLDWAYEEFAALLSMPAREPRGEPWRRTSGIHKVRGRRQLATVRALWQARDEEARRRDIAPGRLLPDAAIIAAAQAAPRDQNALAELPTFRSRSARRDVGRWWRTIQQARELSDDQLPDQAAPTEGPPPPRSWPERDPSAADRLAACRAVLTELAQHHRLPVENLLTPDFVRRLTWQPPEQVTAEAVAQTLRDLGAREWQIAITAQPLADALVA